jgi:hypothetical protein
MAEPGKRIDIAGFLALIKPADLGVALIYIGLFALFLSFSVQNLGAAGSVLIQSSGQEYRYGFDEDRNLDFAGPVGNTTVEISSDGRARFTHSDCRDQICVNAGWLDRGGEWAACLPNRVIIRIDRVEEESEGAGEIDATAF